MLDENIKELLAFFLFIIVMFPHFLFTAQVYMRSVRFEEEMRDEAKRRRKSKYISGFLITDKKKIQTIVDSLKLKELEKVMNVVSTVEGITGVIVDTDDISKCQEIWVTDIPGPKFRDTTYIRIR